MEQDDDRFSEDLIEQFKNDLAAKEKEIEETKAINNSYAEKIKRQNDRIKSLEDEIDGEEAISRDRAFAITKLTTERDHYKALAEAAEEVIRVFPVAGHFINTEDEKKEKAYEKWQALKSQTPNQKG